MSTLINVVFYSTYGHVYELAKAVAEGASSVDGVEANIYQVQETLSDDILGKMGALDAKKAFAQVPLATPEILAEADGLVFGTPTRFGNMAAQMRSFLDSTGQLWAQGALIGKPGGVFVSTGTQHGGQETTITSFHTTLLHHGMVVVGVPYSHQGLVKMDEITGGTPYGASTLAAADGSRQPSKNELDIARFQGKHLAEIAKKLKNA